MAANEEDALHYQQFTFRYGLDNKEHAVETIALRLKRGRVVLVTGPSGAGKTTLCRASNGLIPQEFKGQMAGKVIVVGKYSTRAYGVSALSKLVGVLQQDTDSQLFSPSVEEEIQFGACNYGLPAEQIRERTEQLLAVTRLKQERHKNPHYLSGGQKQSCALAAILSFEPEILVLDEPTSNIDPLGSQEVLDLIARLAQEEGRTTLLIEHKLEDLVHAVDEMVVMEKGKVLHHGTVREVLEHVEYIDSVGLSTPAVTLLAARLRAVGWQIDRLPLDLSEAIEVLSPLIDHDQLAHQPGPAVRRNVAEDAGVVIDFQDVHYMYQDGTSALRGIDLQVRRGEFVAVLGQNGSGKTTLVKHLNGLLKPGRGQVTVAGRDTRKASINQMASLVGYIFQNPDMQICKMKVYDELAFGPKNIGLPREEVDRRVRQAAAALDISHLLEKNPFLLSMGEKQRVAVASVLTMQTEILVLDEPTTGQDARRAREIMNMAVQLHEQGKTILVITHDMNLAAEYCDRVVVMADGKKLLDAPTRTAFLADEVLKQSSLRAPQMTTLGQTLGYRGTWLTVDEAFATLNALRTEVRHGA